MVAGGSNVLAVLFMQILAEAVCSTFRFGAKHAEGSRLRSRLSVEGPSAAFSYLHHGQDWVIGHCGSRERQSPIDFGSSVLWTLPPERTFYYDYSNLEGTLPIQNNGHSIAVDLANQGFGGIAYGGQRFVIMSVVFHLQSEHTFRGRATPMEVHLVHRSESEDRALVVAVPFEVWDGAGGVRSNIAADAGHSSKTAADAAYDRMALEVDTIGSSIKNVTKKRINIYKILQGVTNETRIRELKSEDSALRQSIFAMQETVVAVEQKMAALKVGTNVALFQLLGDTVVPKSGSRIDRQLASPADTLSGLVGGGNFFEYEGSLTAPPCTERITWLVRRDPLLMTGKQLDLLQGRVMQATGGKGNWRSTMPLAGRHISVVSGNKGAPPVASWLFGSPSPAPVGDSAAVITAMASSPSPASLRDGGHGATPMGAENIAQDANVWARQAQHMAGQVEEILRTHPPPGYADADIPPLGGMLPLGGTTAGVPVSALSVSSALSVGTDAGSLDDQLQKMVATAAFNAGQSESSGQIAMRALV